MGGVSSLTSPMALGTPCRLLTYGRRPGPRGRRSGQCAQTWPLRLQPRAGSSGPLVPGPCPPPPTPHPQACGSDWLFLGARNRGMLGEQTLPGTDFHSVLLKVQRAQRRGPGEGRGVAPAPGRAAWPRGPRKPRAGSCPVIVLGASSPWPLSSAQVRSFGARGRRCRPVSHRLAQAAAEQPAPRAPGTAVGKGTAVSHKGASAVPPHAGCLSLLPVTGPPSTRVGVPCPQVLWAPGSFHVGRPLGEPAGAGQVPFSKGTEGAASAAPGAGPGLGPQLLPKGLPEGVLVAHWPAQSQPPQTPGCAPEGPPGPGLALWVLWGWGARTLGGRAPRRTWPPGWDSEGPAAPCARLPSQATLELSIIRLHPRMFERVHWPFYFMFNEPAVYIL